MDQAKARLAPGAQDYQEQTQRSPLVSGYLHSDNDALRIESCEGDAITSSFDQIREA